MFLNLRRLFNVLDRWKWHYLLSALLLIMGMFVRSLEPRVLQFAVDHVIVFFQNGAAGSITAGDFIARQFLALLPDIQPGNAGWILTCLGLLFMAISLLRGGLLLFSSGLSASSTEQAVKRLRDRLFAHIQSLPMRYFTRVSKGELIQRSTGDIDTVRNFILNQVVEIVRISAVFGFSFFMMYSINPQYALISVALGPVLVAGSYLFFKQERKVWDLHETEADKLNTIVQENLNGIRVVKAYANEDFEMARFEAQNREKLRIGIRHMKLHAFYWPVSDFLVNLQIVTAILAGGYFAVAQKITVGELLGFYSYVLMIAWPMRQFGRILSKMGMALVAISRIYEVLDAEPEENDGLAFEEDFRGEIEFRNVSFRYDQNSPDNVLKRISFRIRPGEKVAIIGPTGSGKSTIINLLLGLYEPDRGEILIDGQNIALFSKQQLRKRIGLVLQTPFLFSTTVRENITYANPALEEADMLRSAEIAQVHEIEDVLPEGYDTMVGEKGVTLSGGQKQRVALARTLAALPNILVLDDVTSAVDTRTEFAIFQALKEPMGRKTTIIISHRITSIQQADRVLVVEKGRIVQEGTSAELAEQEGYYREINAIQSGLEDEILMSVRLNEEN